MAQDEKAQKAKLIKRAWTDEEYRSRLSQETLDSIPEPPEGFESMSDEELEAAAGGVTAASCVGIAMAGLALGIQAEEAWD